MNTSSQRTAISLLSGGLDSQLATKMMLDQGIRVIGLHLYTGLCITEHKRRVGVRDSSGAPRQNPVFKVGEDLGIPVEIRDISDTYLSIISKPKYGTGSGVNPCRDCRIHMFERAFEVMEEFDADFIITGEVLGQRPMSQVRQNLEFIHARIPDPDRVLLPLSAHRLEPTLPEREGWVDREALRGIHGRSRREQLKMAREMELKDFETPAGGCCFLTDEAYSRKFKDLFKYDPDKELTMEDIVLLGVGRHFRLSDTAKVIVGRNEDENAVIERHAGDFALVRPPEDVPGPVATIAGTVDGNVLQASCAIAARYTDKDAQFLDMRVITPEQETTIRVAPAKMEEFEGLRL
jgi:tRNA-specific 2-thiouridylase